MIAKGTCFTIIVCASRDVIIVFNLSIGGNMMNVNVIHLYFSYRLFLSQQYLQCVCFYLCIYYFFVWVKSRQIKIVAQ